MRTLLACACLLFAGAGFAQGQGPSKAEVRNAKRELAELHFRRDMFANLASTRARDVRGQRQLDDFTVFVLPQETEQRIDALLASAADKQGDEARTSLTEAQALLKAASAREREIAAYWSRSPAIFWRERWKLFANANGLSAEPPTPQLVEAERAMLEQLQSGDFAAAASQSAPLIARELQAAIVKASAAIAKSKDPATLKVIPNARPCKEVSTHAGPGARITRSGSPNDFYPPSSIRREEEGDIVLRAFVDATGCPTGVAIVVRSGYPDLDWAALQLYEATTFAAGTEDGVAVAGNVTFKVRFKLNEL